MSNRTYSAYAQQKYLASDSTQGAMSITAGRKALDKSGGNIYLTGSTVHRLVPLAGARGAVIQLFGSDANNETLTAVKVWTATFVGFTGNVLPSDNFDAASYVDLCLYGTTGTVTLGNIPGVGSEDIVPTTHFVADTIASWTVGGIAATAETVYGLGGSDEYSPGSDAPASIMIPNFGPFAHAFLIEFDLGTAASANALYTLTP